MNDFEKIENEVYLRTGKKFGEVDSMPLSVMKVLMIFEIINIIEKFYEKIFSPDEIKKIEDFSCSKILLCLVGDS